MFFELLGALLVLDEDEELELPKCNLCLEEEPEVNYWGPSVEA